MVQRVISWFTQRIALDLGCVTVIQVDSIQDARCEYVSDDTNQVSAILRRNTGNVWCECGVTHVDPTTGNLEAVHSVKATCILVTTKCPLSQVAQK